MFQARDRHLFRAGENGIVQVSDPQFRVVLQRAAGGGRHPSPHGDGQPAAIAFGRLGERWGPRAGIFIAIAVYFLITIWGYFIRHPWEFYALAAAIGLVQGGVQSLSRSLYARLIPAEKSGEFFGFYNMLGKFAAVLGPVLMGAVSLLTGNPRLSILSLLVLFAGGALLLARVDEAEGRRMAGTLCEAAAFDAISNPAAWKSACAQLRVVTFKVKTWEKLVMHPMPYLALALMLGPMAQAQVYKWTDANGQVHYDSKPPAEGQAAETLDIQSQPTPAGGVDNVQGLQRATRQLRELRATNRGVPVNELDRPAPRKRRGEPREPPHIGYEDQARIDNLNSDIRRLSSSTIGSPGSRAREIRAAKDELRQIYRKYGIKQ